MDKKESNLDFMGFSLFLVGDYFVTNETNSFYNKRININFFFFLACKVKALRKEHLGGTIACLLWLTFLPTLLESR